MSGKLSRETTSWFAVALDEIRTRRILREKADCKQSISPVPRSPLGTPRPTTTSFPGSLIFLAWAGRWETLGTRLGRPFGDGPTEKKNRPAFLESSSAKASSSNKYPNFSDRHVCLHITTAELFAQKLILWTKVWLLGVRLAPDNACQPRPQGAFSWLCAPPPKPGKSALGTRLYACTQ